MILAYGKVYPSSEQNRILSEMEEKINHTRANCKLDIEKVITVIDTLSKKLSDGEYNDLIAEIDLDNIDIYLEQATNMLRRENIEFKINTELGKDYFKSYETSPPFKLKKIKVQAEPLGTLFHISAGNMDILPSFSVTEGLLTGNINILKLPQADNGLTIKILQEMIEIEPELTEYIYVFDTPSTDIAGMQKMADMADGIVVWGGETATTAVRKLAPTGTKIIEWGHKLGFAYISDYENQADELKALAEHIIKTRQLLCSSCQTIFLDTESIEKLYHFCEIFLPILEKAYEKMPITEIGSVAEITLRRYNDSIEKAVKGIDINREKVFQGTNCNLIATEDSTLELSYMFGSCYVKRLPQTNIMSELRKKKGYLQTAGLICAEQKREYLTQLLINCGVVRVTRTGSMSDTFSGEAHDGEYPLRRYTRIINIEK